MLDSRIGRLSHHLKGHIFIFDKKPAAELDTKTATRLLLIFALLEFILGPRLWILGWLGLPPLPQWARVPMLLAVALLLVHFVARTNVGLHRWREWTKTERSYFVQAIVIGNVVFALVRLRGLKAIAADHSQWGQACIVLLTQLLWGFYQELMYRGILQTALVSRLGPWGGILVANSFFTFGPLHFHHFSSASPFPMFGAIFAIGLLFSVLYWRSGNLWLVGVLHGIGDAYIDGLRAILR